MPEQKKKQKSRSKSKDTTSKEQKSAKKKSSSKSGDKQEKSKTSSKSKSKQPKKKEKVQKTKEQEQPKIQQEQEQEKQKKTPRETDIAGDLSSIPHITHISSNPLSPKEPPNQQQQPLHHYQYRGREELNTTQNPFHLCKLHNKPLTLYCMNNQQPCCYDCSIMGPFNTGLYRVCTLVEAFNQRYSQFNYNIRSSLLPKREQLMAQMVRLEYRLEQVNTASSIIERDIKMEFSNVLSRLKHAQGKKTALLHHDLSIVQQDLRKIDEMVSMMENHANAAGGLASDPPPPMYEQQSLGRAGMLNSLATFGGHGGGNSNQQMLNFLLQFRQLSASVDYSMTKPIKKTIEVNSTDLPRQLAQRRANDEQMSKLKEMLDAKDDVIWQLMQRAKGTQSIQREQANQEIVQQMQKWVNLCDRQAQYIKQLTGSDNIPNMNQDLINPLLQHQTPSKKQNNSFISPSRGREEDISAISNSSMPMLIPSELLRDHPEIGNAMMTMKQACYQKKEIKLQDEFKKKDQEGSGKVTRRQFQNVILQNFVNFQAGMMQILGQILAPQYIDVINYNDFLGLVKNFRNVNKGMLGGGQLGLFDRAGNTGRSTMAGEGSYYGGIGGGVNQSVNLGNSLGNANKFDKSIIRRAHCPAQESMLLDQHQRNKVEELIAQNRHRLGLQVSIFYLFVSFDLGLVNQAQIKNLFVQQLPQLEYNQIISLLRFMSINTGEKVNIEEFANRFDYF